MKALRLALVASAALALLQPLPALAASPTTSAQMPVSGVTAADCMSAASTVPQLADSGIYCSGGQLMIHGTGAAGMTLSPSGLSGAAPTIVLNQAGQGLHITKTLGGGTTNTDVADVFVDRAANYSGGTSGYVNGGLRVTDTVSAGINAYEWAITGIVDNSGTSSDNNENVGIYAQGLKRSTGKTWAAVAELKDYNANPVLTSVTEEFDNNGTGSDSNGNRVINDLFAGSLDGNAALVTYGIRLNTNTNATIGTGLRLNGTYGTGIDLSHASFLGNAFVLGDTNHLCVDSLCQKYLSHNGSLVYTTPAGNVTSISDTGALTTASIVDSGSLSATTGTFSGAVSAGSLSVSGSFSPSSLSASGTISGGSLASSGNITLPSGSKLCFDASTCSNYATLQVNGVVLYGGGVGSLIVSNTGVTTSALSAQAITGTSLGVGSGSISGGAISGSSASISGTASATTFSGNHSGSYIDASSRLSVASSAPVCLDGTTCNYKIYLTGGNILTLSVNGAIYSLQSTGVIGIPSGGAYGIGYTTGVSCSGAPTSSFATAGGIVTHC